MSSTSVASQAASPDCEEILDRIDDLLKQYLYQIDAYERAQEETTSYFSSAFISLARANYANSPAMRYGPDFYDFGMKASRIVNIIPNEDGSTRFKVVEYKALSKEKSSDEEDMSAFDTTKTSDNTIKSKLQAAGPPSEDTQKNAITRQHRDPLRWFGVLVPPSLRDAQTSMISAVLKPVPAMAQANWQMRKLEDEIIELRKQVKSLGETKFECI